MPDRPRLKRNGPAPKVGIVHLGPGAFFRAFNAVYTDEAMQAAGGDWGILAVSLRSPDARDQLEPQGGVFSSVTLGENGGGRIINSVAGVLVAPENPEAVVAAMADPAVRIVSLTITEKGYCHSPATGALDLVHPDIQHDLRALDAPRSAPGFIVAALARRQRAGLAPFTVLSCDNLPANGGLTRRIVLDYAQQVDPGLAEWIAQNVPFPATMVDRITPATTETDVARLGEEAGYFDPACVVHERFRQWVIEDNFAGERPEWEAAGAQFVANVEAHETMKLRCLNGTHSSLAYLGYLAGYETISQTVADPELAAFCRALWQDEILPTLVTPEGESLPDYCESLMARYRDPAIHHRTWQIAMDGSQKLPQRVLGTIVDRLAEDAIPKGLCLAVAGWMRYVGGIDERGAVIDVRDPLAAALKAASDGAAIGSEKVAALLNFEGIFPQHLAESSMFRNAVTEAYAELSQTGAQATIRGYLENA